jgi:hypothetical protein
MPKAIFSTRLRARFALTLCCSGFLVRDFCIQRARDQIFDKKDQIDAKVQIALVAMTNRAEAL